MDNSRLSRAQALCLEAEGLPADARSEFLDDACGGDAALRAEVEALLRGDMETRAVTPNTQPTQPGESHDPTLPAGTLLGAWGIERLAGRGGMGEVYEAQRADGAFKLRAAVKLLKRGLDTEAVVARFNRERRILAQLEHPNIARVLDAGVAPDGRPFLVMEFVDGQPITEYVRGKDPATQDLLRLMITVCEAVQAAHGKQIVHRDLKPSNVLVTPQGQVKLLDFGIAKAVAEEEEGDATRLGGGSALTPAYASPEQLLGLPATPATDVYALGCILYQLLVEKLPHARGGRTTSDIARSLDKETIDRPSTVLRKDRGRLPEPIRLARLKSASKDLDHIVLKALHQAAQRRYATAHDLADDLQRLLDNRPVLARPDSPAYRLSRFVRRNRLPVAAAAAVILALAAGLAVSLWQAHEAKRARNVAEHKQQQAEDLLHFMLGDLREKLEPIGKLAVLDAVGKKAMDYYADSSSEQESDRSLASHAQALQQIGKVRAAMGDLAGAADAYRQALPMTQQVVAHQPVSAAALYDLSDLQSLIGVVHYLKGEWVEAQQWELQGAETAERIVRLQPDEDKWLTRVADARYGVGLVSFQQRKFQEVRAQFDLAQGALRRVQHETDESLATGDRILSVRWAMAGQEDRYEEARDRARELVAIRRKRLELSPGNAGIENELAGAMLCELDSEHQLGGLRPDLPALLDALSLTARLVALDPENTDYRRNRAVALSDLLDARVAAGDLKGADAAARDMLAVARETHRKAPAIAELTDHLLGFLAQAARLAALEDNGPAARERVREAEALPLSNEQREQTNPVRWFDLALTDWEIGRRSPQAPQLRAAAQDWLKKANDAGRPIGKITMLRYEALQGHPAEALAWYKKLPDSDQKGRYVQHFCRVVRSCGI